MEDIMMGKTNIEPSASFFSPLTGCLRLLGIAGDRGNKFQHQVTELLVHINFASFSAFI